MLSCVLLLFALAACAPFLHRLLGRGSSWVYAAAVAGVCAWFATLVPGVVAGEPVLEALPWVPGLGLQLALALDGLSLLFALLITGLGALVLLYGEGYLGAEPPLGRFQALLLFFMGSMLGLVLADDLLLLFVFWELTSISSYLLIGYKGELAEAREAARRAFLVTGAGGLALLVGFLLLGSAGGSFQISELADRGADLREHALYPAMVVLLLLGAFTKSAQAPFHFWLPGAMAAPAPVSSYLHSATMVKAGAYLLARFQPELGGTELWHTLLAVTGGFTMLLGAIQGYAAHDLKRVLACTTVNALGVIVLMLGIGTEGAVKAALVFLLVHALYKGALFMVAGIVDHATGTRDLRELRGLRRALPLTAACALLAGLSMAGMPPLFGFIGKELLYEAKLGAPRVPWLPTVLGVTANVLIVATALMVGWLPFAGKVQQAPRVRHQPSTKLQLGPTVLATLGLAIGVLPGILAEPLVRAAAVATRAEPTVVDLKLWHGINPVLLLSVATVAGGVLAFVFRGRVLRATRSVALLAAFGPARGYELALTGLVRVARWQTRLLQHGVLRRHVRAVLLVTVALAALPLLRGDVGWPFDGRLDLRAHEAALLLAIAAACVAGARATSRLAAALSLSVVGLALSLLFLGFGAPDLAMTQVAVETLVVLVLVLVLSGLPRLAPRPDGGRLVDVALALCLGALVAGAVRAVLALERQPELGRWFAERSYPDAHGRNVVNVILVDFRAIDTLGEITVLGIAAVGVVALLARAKKREEAA